MSVAVKAFTGDAESYFHVPFQKVVEQEDGTVQVFGRPTTETLDIDQQIVDHDFVKRALPKWMQWGNIREMHQAKAVGRAKELQWDEEDQPWLTAHVVDSEAVKKVKAGVLQGFSIGVNHPKYRHDQKAPRGRMIDGEIIEVSLVDRPADPDCRVVVVKAAGVNEWIETGVAEKGTWDQTMSGDFDEFGNPILQPGHVRSDDAEISVVTMDDRGVVLRMGQEEYVVPYTVNSSGQYEFGEPERLPNDPKAMPGDPRENEHKGAEEAKYSMSIREQVSQKLASEGLEIIGTYGDMVLVERWPEGKFYKLSRLSNGELGEPEQVEEAFVPVKTAEKAAGDLIRGRRAAIAELGKAVWTTKYIDDLPDSSFAYVEPGGERKDGKTEPKSLRHLPYKDAEGKPDPAHVRNALARLDQTDIPEDAKKEALRKLRAAAEEVGIEVGDTKEEKAKKLLESAEKAVKEAAYCPECKKRVKIGDKVDEKAAPGGKHSVYKGDCGHMVRKFEAETKTEEKGADTSPPSGMGTEAEPGAHNGEGEPAGTAGEKQEDDILARMRKALGELEANQKKEEGSGKDDEGPENRALAQLKELVNAFVSQQEREAIAKGDVGAKDNTETADMAKAVALELAKLMGVEVGKAGRKIKRERLDKLKEHHQKLGDLIDELDDEKSEDGEKAVKNDGAAPSVTRKDVTERIRVEVEEIGRLAREVEDAERQLNDEAKVEAGNLGPDQNPVAPEKKPGGETWNQRQGDGSGAALGEAGEDTKAMYKTLAAEIGKAVSEPLSTAAETIKMLSKRLEFVEHQARPFTKADLYMAEHSGEFGNPTPQVQKYAADQARQEYSKMSPEEQKQFATRLISEARKAQR